MAALTALALAASLAPPAPALAQAGAAQTYTFAFQDADVRQVAQAILGDALGLTYTVDPDVNAKVTFRIDRRLTRAQLLQAFEAALATYNVVLVREGDSILLTPRSKAKASAGLSVGGGGAGSRRAGFGTEAVPLSYATPSEVAKALQAMTGADVVAYTDDAHNLIVLAGTPQEIEAAKATIRTLDRSSVEGSKVQFFELNNVPAAALATDLGQVLQASKIVGVTIVPMRRMNGVIVFTRSDKVMADVAAWIAKLDVPGKDGGSSLHIYRPKNVSAESLAQTLTAALGGDPGVTGSPTGATGTNSGPAPSQPPSSPMLASGSGDDEVRIGVDKETNALLISASPAKWHQIETILAEFDQTPGEVLIEAYVVEVTLNNDSKLGVDWSLLGAGGRLGVSSSTNRTGTVGPSYPGLSVTYLGGDLKVALNTLESTSAVEVVSNPKIFVLDNHVGSLQVGDQVPVVTQTGQSTSAPGSPVVNNVEYRSTGIILTVKPRITGDNKIVLDVTQEVSSVAETTTSGIDSPTIQQRKMSTTLVLDNNGLVALGGLISTNRSVGDSGVPYLKSVPVVGNLFKSSSHDKRRTELVVLITARVVRDRASSDKVLSDTLDDMHEIDARGLIKP